MNVFTKEELIQMHKDFTDPTFQKYAYALTNEQKAKLIDKLQYMIDNYCEHAPDKGLHTMVSFRSVVSNKINKCLKCGKYYLEDN